VTTKENSTAVNDAATVTVIPIVNLVVNKTVNVKVVPYDEYAVFTINVTNKGPSNATNVVIQEIFPNGLSFYESSDGRFDNHLNQLVIDLLEPGQSIEFTITVWAMDVGNWTNVVEVTSDENSTPVKSNASVEVVNVKLSVVKDANVTVVGNNTLVNFTITVKNDDVFDANYIDILDSLPYGFAFVNATEGYYEYDTVFWYLSKLSAGSNVTYWIVAKTTELGNLTNNVTVIFNEGEYPLEANSTVEVVPVELTVNKTANVNENIGVGDEVTFTVNITNKANMNATVINITDAVPTGFEFVRTNATGYDNKTGILIVPIIKAGESYVFTITLKALTNGT
jgi:uncharacterized repeat protein (TIGR01451 family)